MNEVEFGAWTVQERWTWHQICATAQADLSFFPAARRTLSAAFLQRMLFAAPYRDELPSEGVHISHARIEGRLSFVSHAFSHALALDNSTFDGPVLLQHFATLGSLSFEHSTFTKALDMRSLRSGDVILQNARFESIDLSSASINGILTLDGSRVTNALTLAEAKITSNVTMDRVRKVPATIGSLKMTGAEIGGRLSMTYSVIKDDFDMSDVSVGRRADFDGGSFPAYATFVNAHVGGHLALPDHGGDLDLTGVNVGGDVAVTNARYTSVDLGSATVSGEVRFDDSTVGVLNMRELKVDQDLKLFNSRFRYVSIENGTIGGSLHIDRSAFDKQLIVSQETIGGNLDVFNDRLPPEPTLFGNMSVTGNLQLSGGKFGSLDFTGTKSSGDFLLGSYGPVTWFPDALLNLRNVTVRAVEDRNSGCRTPGDGCPSPWPPQMDLGGFTYQTLGSRSIDLREHLSSDIARRTKGWWAAHWLPKGAQFNPQPYDQLASVLKQLGQQRTANDVLFERADQERLEAQSSVSQWPQSFGLYVHRESIGYGYRVWRAVPWALAFVFIGITILHFSGESRRLHLGSGAIYSFDMLLPVIKLEENNYKLQLRSGVRHYFYAHKLVGWVLASFLLAGLSGLAK
jgi:uncharacterized protein YjbI with pentapeptide repeats